MSCMFNCLPAVDVIAIKERDFFSVNNVDSDNVLCSVLRQMASKDLAALANCYMFYMHHLHNVIHYANDARLQVEHSNMLTRG